MTWMAMAAVSAVVLAGVSRLVRTALRHGHLLALLEAGGRTRWYERAADGRYAPLPAVRLPAALRRFVCGVPAPVRVRARNGER
ncbi:MAG TPA: hypothetical protein VHG08_06935 [Longimicrobium sp.]|nr:hypothetical protein [Longimicrobium sp.]